MGGIEVNFMLFEDRSHATISLKQIGQSGWAPLPKCLQRGLNGFQPDWISAFLKKCTHTASIAGLYTA
jgi:hypothetical protein